MFLISMKFQRWFDVGIWKGKHLYKVAPVGPIGRWNDVDWWSCRSSVGPMIVGIGPTVGPILRRPIVSIRWSKQLDQFGTTCTVSPYLLPPPRRLCFHLRLSVCLLNRILKKNCGMAGHDPGSHRLHFEWPWPIVKVTRGQTVKIVLRTIHFKIVAESETKIKILTTHFSE